MLIDSHCHLPHLAHKAELEQILARAAQNDVEKFVNVGTNFVENKRALEVAQAYSSVYATAAIYPHEELDKTLPELRGHLASLLGLPKLVAIGECGIDTSTEHGGRSIQSQLELFDMQVKLALDANLPIIIHNRGGDSEILKTLTKYRSTNLRGVAHCFASTWDIAQKLLDLNFYISFSGMITFNSRAHILETVKNVPLDRFVIETDSPYLTPRGVVGKEKSGPNEPKNVRIVAQKVADVRGQTYGEIAHATYTNTCKIFDIW